MLCTLRILRKLGNPSTTTHIRCVTFGMPGVASTALADHVKLQGWNSCFLSFAVPGDVSSMAAVRIRACDDFQGKLDALGSAWLAQAVQRHADYAVQATSLRQHLCLLWRIRQLWKVVMAEFSGLGMLSYRPPKSHKQQADGSLSVRRSYREPALCSEPFLRHQITCTLAATGFWIFLSG